MTVQIFTVSAVWPAIAQVASTAVIGLIAAGVACYGVYVQRRKLDLDLFDNRFEFYSVFLRYKRATRSASGVSAALDREFARALSKGKFLFPKKVSEIVLEVASLGDEYQDLKADKGSDIQAVRRAALSRRTEIRKAQDQLIGEFEKAVEKHLRFAR